MGMGMRSTLNNRELIEDRTETVIGVNMGFDFTAEHEFGIDPLKRELGLGDGSGIEARTIERYEKERWLVDPDGGVIGYCNRGRGLLKQRREGLRNPRDGSERYGDRELLTATWGQDGFLMRVRSDHDDIQSAFEDLVEGYERQQLTLTLNAPSWTGGGLCLMRPDKINRDDRLLIDGVDREQALLDRRAEQTDIPELLDESDCGAFALTPRWAADHHDDVETDFDILFYLNPEQQSRHDSGYFTVEQLEQWLVDDEGPVIKDSSISRSGY